MLNSDMRAGYIKENNASKDVTCPRTKISQPEILILHYLKICKKLRLILNQKQSTVSFTTSFLFLFYSLTNFG